MVSESLKKVDQAELLWKSIARQPEFQAGAFRLNADITIRTFKNQSNKFLTSERFDFIIAMKELLKPIADLENEKIEYLIFRTYECYMKELAYNDGTDSRFSIDIVFQFIELQCHRYFWSYPKLALTL